MLPVLEGIAPYLSLVALVAALVLVFYLSHIDVTRAFRTGFLNLSPRQVQSPMLVMAFRDSFVKNHYLFSFRARIYLWPIAVTMTLLLLFSFSGPRTVIEALIPKIFTDLLERFEGEGYLLTAALMVIFCVLIRLPSIDGTSRQPESTLTKLISFYHRILRRYVRIFVLLERDKDAVANLAVAIEHQLRRRFLNPAERNDFVRRLGKTLGETEKSRPHQVLLRYIQQKGGFPAAYSYLKQRRLGTFEWPFRGSARFREINSKEGVVPAVYEGAVKSFGASDYYDVDTIFFPEKSIPLPVGRYRIVLLAGKVWREKEQPGCEATRENTAVISSRFTKIVGKHIAETIMSA